MHKHWVINFDLEQITDSIHWSNARGAPNDASIRKRDQAKIWLWYHDKTLGLDEEEDIKGKNREKRVHRIFFLGQVRRILLKERMDLNIDMSLVERQKRPNNKKSQTVTIETQNISVNLFS